MCDSIVVTGAHTTAGSTLFGKNSDRREGECQPFLQFPAALHPRGSRVRCTHVEIPQVAETYRVMGHSPWWVWGFEHGVNEHGVAIGNQTVFSKEPVEAAPGLIGMDLVRLGLERGRDAREALEVIAGLIEANGQGGSALAPGEAGYHNSFTIAGPRQAWLLETSGRRWAARRVEVGSLSNHIHLDTSWHIGSRDLESFARAEGWWRDTGRLDVARAYRNTQVPGSISEGRLARSRALLEAGAPDGHDVASFQRILRDHGDEHPAPPQHLGPENADYFTLCMHSEPVGTSTASLIASLPTDRSVPWPVWICFGPPCIGIYLPLYMEGVLPDVLARGGEDFEEGSAWWVFERLRQAAAVDFAERTPVLRAGWSVLEEKIEHERRGVEREARAAALEDDPQSTARVLSDFMARSVGEVLDTAEELRSRIS